jgi:hypothetical protein
MRRLRSRNGVSGWRNGTTKTSLPNWYEGVREAGTAFFGWEYYREMAVRLRLRSRELTYRGTTASARLIRNAQGFVVADIVESLLADSTLAGAICAKTSVILESDASKCQLFEGF